MPPYGRRTCKAAQYDQLLGQSHACRGRLDLPERVVARVTLGNILAALTMLATLSCPAVGTSVLDVGALPNPFAFDLPAWQVRYRVQEVSSFSSIEKISPALSSRLR